jgi:antirestriction protein
MRASGGGDMELFAQPYDTSAYGFSFKSFEEFEEKYEKNLPVEEYEIDLIDGTDEEITLFKVASITQANLKEWFDAIDTLNTNEMPAVYFLLENGSVSSFEEAVQKAGELRFSEGDIKAYVEQYIDDLGGPAELGKETLEQYFDYESFARDMDYNGEVSEFTFAGTTYTADPNSV